MEMVNNHLESDDLAPITKSFTVVKFLDQLPSYLRKLHGVSHVSLAYVIREISTVPNPLPALLHNVP